MAAPNHKLSSLECELGGLEAIAAALGVSS
jgi:hypothetical protein